MKAVEVEGCLPELSQVWFAERLDVKCAKLLPDMVTDLEAQAVQVSKNQTVSRDEINRILSGCQWVKRGKRAVEENGRGVMATFGAFTHGGVHGLTRISYRCPELVRLLNRYVREVAPEASYSALAVSEGTQLDWHRDVHNLSGCYNWVIPVGNFEGGEIRVLPEGVKQDEADLQEWVGLRLSVADKPISFNPRRRHCVLPHTGHRLVLVGYTPRGYAKLSGCDRRRLEFLGFPLPVIGDHVTLRAMLHEAEAFSEEGVNRESGYDEADFESSSDESQREVSSKEGLQAFVLDEGRSDRLVADAAFLSRVVTLERRALLEEVRASGSDSPPSVSALVELEVELRGCEQELELSDLSLAVLDDTTQGLQTSRWSEARLKVMFGLEPPRVRVAQVGVSDTTTDESAQQPEVFFQAKTIDPAQAAQEIHLWLPCITEEYVGLTTQYRALKPRHSSEVNLEDGNTEVIPSKIVYTRKPPLGQRRARIVACGNYSGNAGKEQELEMKQPGALARQSLYAGGIDTYALRVQLRYAAIRRWASAGVDFRKAFLYAPLSEDAKTFKRIVLKPPRRLVKVGLVCETELWEVVRAVYGLDVSPAIWGRHRDARLLTLVWEFEGRKYCVRPLISEASLWQILPHPPPESASGQAKGLLGIYVDDLLISSEEGMINALIAAIETLWEVSKPQHASSTRLHFLGVDIHNVGGYYYIGQQDYISSLLEKHKEIEGQSPVPYPSDKDPEEPEEFNLANVRLAQAWVGEMTWLSTKTRSDLAWPVNRAAQLVSKNPLRSIEACKTMLRYLRGTQGLCLVYGPQDGEPCQVATYSDASFAPSGERSQSGVCLLWANALLAWGSNRQSFLTMSTCESELYAAVEAYILSQSLKDLLEELSGPVEVTLYGDNVAAVSVIVLPSGSWRTAANASPEASC